MAAQSETHVDSVKDLLDAFVICRTMGHAWEEAPTLEYQTIFNWTGSFQCTRCTCAKIEAYNNIAEVIYRRYLYPSGYRIVASRQGERMTSTQMRAELMRRQILVRRRSGAAPKMPRAGQKLVLADG